MSNPNNRPGYRGNPADPRLSQQQGYSQRPVSQHLQQGQPRPQGGQRIQSYGMDQLNRPRPPPHNRPQQGQGQQQHRSSRTPQPQQQYPQHRTSQQPQQQQYQSSRQQQQQGGRPMRPPSNYANANPAMGSPNAGQGPYRRVSMNRSRSLSRPERQRPRTGMIRSPSQQQRINQQQQQQQQQQRYGPNGPPPNMRARPNNQPMPNRLQHQLQQQKLYQQEALLDQPNAAAAAAAEGAKKPQEIPEEEVKVLTSWWAWMAFLMTCCIPNWFLGACLKKKNAMVQQAWREKVISLTKKIHSLLT